MLAPDFWNDQRGAQSVIRRRNSIKDIIDSYNALHGELASLDETADELKTNFDEELMMMAEEEYAQTAKNSRTSK